ncbi:MAG: VIT1/CCC1 transporter family protein [Akkermansiaceae bacterium]
MSHHDDHAAEHTPEAIRKRLKEGMGNDYLKDSILGAIDGAVTTFAVVSSVAGAGLSSSLVIVLGIANMLADGFSMAAGNFSGTRAENQSARKFRREEEEEIENHPEGEREEIRQIFKSKGFKGDTLEQVVDTITSDKKRWVDTMIQEEHGLPLHPPSAIKSGLTTLIAFLTIGTIPLLAYFLDAAFGIFSGSAFPAACVLTGISFFAIGAFKSKYTDQHWLSGGLETLLIGTIAAAMAYLIGFLLRPLVPE